ncbi:MAG: ABC transporter permease [Acidobacteriia bacterium]|nr:ABC transporter permease [Terriglobia bacterium]
MKKLFKLIYFPFRDVRVNAHLISTLVRRDFASRYRASSFGVFWTLVQPAFMLAVYTVTFSLIMKVRFGADDSPSSFVLYLFCGMLPWLAFSEALTRSSTVVVDNANFVKKLVFPTQILPVNMTLTALITEFLGMIILLAAILFVAHSLHRSLIYFPLILVPQILFTLGLAWFLSSLTVFIRDISNFLNLILTAWLFFTPIFYPERIVLESNLPPRIKSLFSLNPMFIIVNNYRRVFLEGKAPDTESMGILLLISCVVFWGGYAWFDRTKKSFADVL